MKDEILRELAAKWERMAKEPEVGDGSEQAQLSNALEKGIRIGMRGCATDVNLLIRLLGEQT